MDIKKQFNQIAQEYDDQRRTFIPCFDDFYLNTTKLIASNLTEPKRIVDLGAGTGLLSYHWHQHYPNARLILVDVADKMLDIARKRFEAIETISYQVMNYIYELPNDRPDAYISALSIHHLEDAEKQKLFSRIYERLPKNGLFVNYDQFCAGQAPIDDWYNAYWENQLYHSGLTEHDIAWWKERRKLDRECSVEREIEMLKACQFQVVKCVYSFLKFSVIVAIK